MTSSVSEMADSIQCDHCASIAQRRIKTVPQVAIPYKHRAAPDASKYYYTKKEQRLNARMGKNPK